MLSVELMQGRRMTLSNVNGVRRINAQVVFQLARQDDDEKAAVDQGSSGVRIWTKAPVWNQTFELGPVRDLAAMTLRVICLDRGLAKIGKRGCGCACRRKAMSQKPTSVPSRARAMSFSEEPSAQIEVKLANVFLLGNAAPNNARKGIVGWFPLVPKDVGGSRLTGELKLRFHLKRAHLLEGLDEACRQELIAHPAAYIRVLNRHTSYEPAAW